MAVLFVRSGWTQEELAQKEGLDRTRITQRLRFGRFLNFIATAINAEKLPINLTERKFRHYWSQTDKAETNERIRFRATYNLIEDIHLRRRNRPRRLCPRTPPSYPAPTGGAAHQPRLGPDPLSALGPGAERTRPARAESRA